MELQAPGPGVAKRPPAPPEHADLLAALRGPPFVVVEEPGDWARWMARAASGEVVIESVEVVSGHNGSWRLGLYWPEVPSL